MKKISKLKPKKQSISKINKNKIIDTAVEQFANILVALVDERTNKEQGNKESY